MIDNLLGLTRITKQLLTLFIDIFIILSVAIVLFWMDFGFYFLFSYEFLLILGIAPIISTLTFIKFGLYRSVLRYLGIKTIWLIIRAVTIYSIIWGLFSLVFLVDKSYLSFFIINWMLSLVLIIGVRIFARSVFNGNFKSRLLNSSINTTKKRILVYGAGKAGVQLVSALEYSDKYSILAFIDDSVQLQGRQIKGLEVYSLNNIKDIIIKYRVQEVLIAMPSVSRTRRIKIINILEKYSVLVRLLPSISALADGNLVINDLHEVSTDDLLGRNKVKPNLDLLSKNITDKVILVTGAGGSIGTELCKQIISLKPKALVLFEISEIALYTIEKTLTKINVNTLNIYPILGNVNNKLRFSSVLKQFDVNTIYHAAAYKHVPIVEFNNLEGVNNNIFGTLICAQTAIEESVETFVLISTDKAVRPTNTMGATKRTAELILQALSKNQSKTKFSMVRFGNVLGSSGSVIPLFKKQIKDGGPITVTDKNIYRYFMTINEAVELVIQAGAIGEGGEVFVLDMGDPVSISDLATKMINLSGLRVKDDSNAEGDIEIKYIGIRPGEKLYEELLIGNNVNKTINPKIMQAKESMLTWDELEPILNDLKEALELNDLLNLRKLLIKLVPEFKPQSDISDLLFKKL